LFVCVFVSVGGCVCVCACVFFSVCFVCVSVFVVVFVSVWVCLSVWLCVCFLYVHVCVCVCVVVHGCVCSCVCDLFVYVCFCVWLCVCVILNMCVWRTWFRQKKALQFWLDFRRNFDRWTNKFLWRWPWHLVQHSSQGHVYWIDRKLAIEIRILHTKFIAWKPEWKCHLWRSRLWYFRKSSKTICSNAL